MNTRLMAAAVLTAGMYATAICEAAQPVMVRIPCRFVRTSYMVNMDTGATFDERKRERLGIVCVDISRKSVDGTDVYFFKVRPTNGEKDKTDVTTQVLPVASRVQFLAALEKARKALSTASAARTDAEDTLFEDTELKLVLFTGKKSFLKMKFGEEAIFELSGPHISQLSDAIKKL